MTKQDTLPGLQTPLEEGEPVFPLRARDSMAPHFAALWAALAAGDTASALVLFADLNAEAAYKYRHEPREPEKVNSASAKAQEMMQWRADKGLSHQVLHTVRR